MEDIGESLVAVLVSILAAALTLIFVVVVVSGLVGTVGFKLGLLSAEGEAWIGISLGIPLGLVCAILVFVYCFKRIRGYGRLP